MTPSPAPWPWIPSHTQLFCRFDQGVTSAILHPHSRLGAFAHAVLPSPDSFSLHSDIKPGLVLPEPAQVSPCLEVSQHPRHRFLSLAPLALVPLYLLFFFSNCTDLFLVMLGLRHYTGFSLAAASRGYSLAGVHGVLIAVASLDAEHGVRACVL